MTTNNRLALALGFVAAVGLGIWIGPHITRRSASISDATASTNGAPELNVENQRPARAAKRPATKSVTTSTAATRTPTSATARSVPAAAPALHEVLKPLLNKGADMGVASQEFVDAEQFAAVAHAARNTEVPFMVLKHRIVDEGKSLEAAIHESKPGLNAAVEAGRARAEAKSDIVALQG
jgi:hypothetical protein